MRRGRYAATPLVVMAAQNRRSGRSSRFMGKIARGRELIPWQSYPVAARPQPLLFVRLCFIRWSLPISV